MDSGSPNLMNPRSSLWREICKTRGEQYTKYCYLLQKYVQAARNLYCKLWKSVGHDKNKFWAYELMIEWNIGAYRMLVEEHGHEEHGKCSGWGGYQGRGRGGRAGRGHV